MSGTYKALGINLKSTPLGESDRLLTILTEEFGLVRAVAPGSRKHNSSLGGRSGLFVVNQLFLVKGKTLDKVIQAESLESYPGLSQDLSKLTASQYLAELALYQALSDQPQAELFHLLREHLSRLENLPKSVTLPCLTHATFHLLVLAGVAPQVQACCVTQQPITPNLSDPNWQIGFSIVAGGTGYLSELEQLPLETKAPQNRSRVASSQGTYAVAQIEPSGSALKPSELSARLNATELDLLQQLAKPDFIQDLIQTQGAVLKSSDHRAWLSVERVLRHYAQYHFERPIRSATLIDVCFAPADAPLASE